MHLQDVIFLAVYFLKTGVRKSIFLALPMQGDTLRMCRAFRHLAAEKKSFVYNYGLKKPKSKEVCFDKPSVMYCKWHLKGSEEQEDDEHEEE
jgi:hypothetical protein